MGVLNLMTFMQVVLESLPISSSGHLKLLFEMTGCAACFEVENFKLFYYFLHGPTFFIFSLFFMPYWIRIIRFRPFVFFFIIEAVTFSGYGLLSTYLKTVPLALGFIITFISLLATRFLSQSHKKNEWSKKDAVVLGCAQVAALIPGISRMGMLFFVARRFSYSSSDAFAIACIADIPLALGGFLFGIMNLCKGSSCVFLFKTSFLLTLLCASVLGYMALFFVAFLVKSNRLWWLSWYMLLPIVLSLFV